MKYRIIYLILMFVYVLCGCSTGMKNVRSCFMPHLFVIDKTIEELYFDTIVLFESAKLLQNDENKTAILKHLEIALNMIRFNNVYSQEFYDGIASAKKYLAEEIYDKENDNCDVTVSCIGHTHIDIAWLWTIAQTVEKAQRSFSTVLNLMRQYPEYKFMSSQAILYGMVKEYAPDLYAEIKERVAEGRWEVDGAMWLECDCNLSSGESIIRQILYGKRFFKDEFGKESKTLWLPDTFGYSAAMPQILKKCGVDNFVTSKISWNDTNTIPHDTFLWQGIDGTEIFTNFMSAQRYKGYDFSERITTYVPQITPEYVLGSWARYQEKAYNNRTLLTYGFGDGGGGPTMEMLEYQRRLEKGVPGIPKTKITTSEEHLKTVKENFYRNCEIIGRISFKAWPRIACSAENILLSHEGVSIFLINSQAIKTCPTNGIPHKSCVIPLKSCRRRESRLCVCVRILSIRDVVVIIRISAIVLIAC